MPAFAESSSRMPERQKKEAGSSLQAKIAKYFAIAKINLHHAFVYRSNVLGGLLFYNATLPFGILSAAFGLVINFFLLMCLGLTSFRLEENGAFFLIYQKLVFMLGMFIPLEFLPDWLQRIARWLPFPYVAWAPARLIVAFSWDLFWQVLPMQVAWTVVAIGLSLILFRQGMRGLQANGG